MAVTAPALAGIAALAAAIGLIALARRDYPLGGEPFAVTKVEVAPTPAPPQPAPREASKSVQEAVAPAIASADQVEAASGVKVTRAGGGGAPNALIIDVPQALAVRLEAAPDPRLVEEVALWPPTARRRRRGASVRGLREVDRRSTRN